jgi:hypothetical protein
MSVVEFPGYELRGRCVGDRVVVTLRCNASAGPIGSFSIRFSAVDDLAVAFAAMARQLTEDLER